MNTKRVVIVFVALFVAAAMFANGQQEQDRYKVVFGSALIEIAPDSVKKVQPTQAILDIFLDAGITSACLDAAPAVICRTEAEAIRKVIAEEGTDLTDKIRDVLIDVYDAGKADFVYMVIGRNSWNVHTVGKGNFDIEAHENIQVASK